MAIMEEVSDRGLALPIGIGLAIAAVSAAPKLVKAGRPLIKGAIKGYLIVASKSKEMFAETGERLQDLYAEAKHEYDEEVVMAKAEEGHKPEQMAEEPKAAEGRKRPSRARKTEEGESEQE